MPLDVELYLGAQQVGEYKDVAAQRSFFLQTIPVARFLEKIFRDRGMPYLLDYTPSGAHLLFQNLVGNRATAAVMSIGCIEDDLLCLIPPDDAEMAPYKSIDLFWVVKSGANRIVQFCFNATSVHPIQGPVVAFLIGRLAGRDDVIDAKLID
jgi:hypothetical protein